MTTPGSFVRVSAEDLVRFTAEVLAAAGLPADDARTTAGLIVEADLLGVDTHGVFRLAQYLGWLSAGAINKTPDIRIERRKGAVALVDGDNAMGHLVMKRCAEEAIAIAREFGIGWVGCHHGNHAGAAGIYAMMPVREGMVGLYGAVGPVRHMAPWGGILPMIGTNPLAIGVPAGAQPPMLLDMATSTAAFGKIKVAADRGEAIPEGWAIGPDGLPLTDPTKMAGASLLPIGGAKGYGLALAIGLLAGTLNGAAFNGPKSSSPSDPSAASNTGQFICALDLAAFGDPEVIRAEVDEVLGQMKSSPPRPGFDAVRIPGERSLALRERHLAEGVPVAASLFSTLATVARDRNVTPVAAL
jgi:LDH2 family malate/lactate/ureidoglycolate dehydrogenase